MAFVPVLVPIGIEGQQMVEDAVQGAFNDRPGYYLVLRVSDYLGKQDVVAALEAAGLRVPDNVKVA